jgi:hypothetical protein
MLDRHPKRTLQCRKPADICICNAAFHLVNALIFGAGTMARLVTVNICEDSRGK